MHPDDEAFVAWVTAPTSRPDLVALDQSLRPWLYRPAERLTPTIPPTQGATLPTKFFYGIWHNADSHYMRGFQPGDRIIQGYLDTCESAIPDLTALRACDVVFRKHNLDDRPDGRTAPSLSVGDVVSLSMGPEHVWQAFTCEPCGWSVVDPSEGVQLEGPVIDRFREIYP